MIKFNITQINFLEPVLKVGDKEHCPSEVEDTTTDDVKDMSTSNKKPVLVHFNVEDRNNPNNFHIGNWVLEVDSTEHAHVRAKAIEQLIETLEGLK